MPRSAGIDPPFVRFAKLIRGSWFAKVIVMSEHVMSEHVMSERVMSERVMSERVMSQSSPRTPLQEEDLAHSKEENNA